MKKKLEIKNKRLSLKFAFLKALWHAVWFTSFPAHRLLSGPQCIHRDACVDMRVSKAVQISIFLHTVPLEVFLKFLKGSYK